jgi:hypothetical protein
MRIDEIIRVQEGFKQQKSQGKNKNISKEITEKIEFNVIKALMGKVNNKKGKGKNKTEMPPIATQSNPAYNLSLSSCNPRPPMFGGDGNFDGIWTKMERTMTDDEIHQAHKELAIEYADKAVAIGNSGKSRSMIANELLALDKWYSAEQNKLMYQYICPFSPDRKEAYAKSDGYIVELNEPLAFGNTWTMLWGPSGWSTCPTPTENQRMQEFMKTHFDTLNEYEAEHGQIPYAGQYTNRVITTAPVRNYL